MTHICVGNLTIIGSDNGLSPGRHQGIIWTNAGILLIGPLGTNFSEILTKIITFSFMKMYFKVPSAKWRPFCLGLNVLKLLSSITKALLTHTLASFWRKQFCTFLVSAHDVWTRCKFYGLHNSHKPGRSDAASVAILTRDPAGTLVSFTTVLWKRNQ